MRTKRQPTTNLCGRRIKVARIEAGMKQIDLAAALAEEHGIQVDQNSISHMEKGTRYVKDFEIIALAQVLDKHPMWLLFGDKIPQEYAA